jgi:uncharacterized membrane protein
MLSLVLAFGSGMSWGTADFLGGLSARRCRTAVAVVCRPRVSSVLGIVAIRGRAPAGSEAVALGLAAGAMGAIGLSALYRALAIGPMGVVAPTAALSGTVPVAWGLLRGDRPGPLQLVGVALAIAGVILASRVRDGGGEQRRARGIGLALLAAVTLGALLVLLDAAGRSDPVWGTLMVRVGALTLLLVALAARRPRYGCRAEISTPARWACSWRIHLSLPPARAGASLSVLPALRSRRPCSRGSSLQRLLRPSPAARGRPLGRRPHRRRCQTAGRRMVTEPADAERLGTRRIGALGRMDSRLAAAVVRGRRPRPSTVIAEEAECAAPGRES